MTNGRSKSTFRIPDIASERVYGKPILFAEPMVRALLDGCKTQTRRVLKPQPDWVRDRTMFWRGRAAMIHAHDLPYAPGDRLWVREAWAMPHGFDLPPTSLNTMREKGKRPAYRATDNPNSYSWRSPIHMFRWASRLTLTVTDVRVQRVQEISEADAWAGGIAQRVGAHCRDDFRDLWDSLNAKRTGCSWADSPWVAAITFIVHHCNIDQIEDPDAPVSLDL